MQHATLIQVITVVRNQMYILAQNYEYTHPSVVSCSQLLDSLLNEYQRLQLPVAA